MTRAWWLNAEIRKVFEAPLGPIDWSTVAVWLAMVGVGITFVVFVACQLWRAFGVFIHKAESLI